MPNLRGANSVGCDSGGRSYASQAISKRGSGLATSWSGQNPRRGMGTTVFANTWLERVGQA